MNDAQLSTSNCKYFSKFSNPVEFCLIGFLSDTDLLSYAAFCDFAVYSMSALSAKFRLTNYYGQNDSVARNVANI